MSKKNIPQPVELNREELSLFIERASDPDTHFVISLGSGAMLALASGLSILDAIDQLGLRKHVDEVWGVSSGSMAAGLWCSGTPVHRVMEMLRELRRMDLVDVAWRHILKGLATRKWDGDVIDGALNGKALHGRIKKQLSCERVEQTEVPLRILLAHDDGTARLKVVKKGNLADAIRCSTAMQAVFRPGTFEGERYVDPTMLEKTPLPSIINDYDASGNKKKLLILACFFGYHGQLKPIKGLSSRLFFFKEVLQYQVFLAHLTSAMNRPNTEVIVYSPCIHDVPTLAVEQADQIFWEVREQMATRFNNRYLEADPRESDPDFRVPRWCPTTWAARDK